MIIWGYLPAVLFAETLVTGPEIPAVGTKQGAGIIEIQSQAITKSDTGFHAGIVAAITICIHGNVTGRTKNSDRAAGSIMSFGNLGHPTTTVITVGNAVTSTDRIPNIRTSLGDDHAPAKLIGKIASTGRKFAELVGPVTGDPRKSAADLWALALTGDVHAGRGGVTRISVGIPVTTANRIIYLGAYLRLHLTYSSPIVTDTGVLCAIFSAAAFTIVLANLHARPVVLLGNASHLAVAVIAIGHTVAATHRIPY